MATAKRLGFVPNCLFLAALLGIPSGVAAQSSNSWDPAFSFGTFAGRFQFADSTYLQNQKMFGGSAALDFGRGVALRGYYWQGANDDWDRTVPLSGYGAELQFDIFSFSILKPFFLGGIGKMEFGDAYEDELGRTPETTTTSTLGGGVAVDLARWLRLDVTARNYMFQGPNLPGSEVADVRHSNFLLTAGATFTFGRRKNAASAASVVRIETGPSGVYAAPGQIPPGMVLVPADRAAAGGAAPTSDLEPRLDELLADEAVRYILAAEMGYLDVLYPELSKLGEERLSVSGERADTLRIRLTRRMHEAFEYLATAESAGVLAALDAQLDAYNVTLDAKDAILAAARETLDQRRALMEADGRRLLLHFDSVTALERAETSRRHRGSGALGGTFGDGGQLVLSGQMGFPAPWSPKFSVVPEVALGFFGGGTSALIQGSLRYFQPMDGVEPYVGLGLGVLVLSDSLAGRSGADFVVTPILGLEIPGTGMRDVFGRRFNGYFVEYQGVGFFDLNRVAFGLNWSLGGPPS